MQNMIQFDLPKNPFASFKESAEKLTEALKKIAEAFEVVAEQLPPSLRTLASHGWYVSANSGITDSIKLAAEISKGNINKVNKQLQEFYQADAKRIISHLRKTFPERKKLFDEALKAHQRKMYFASTSLFLSLADGLCNGSLFITKNNKASLKKYLANKTYLEDFLKVISEVSAIDTAHYKKNSFPSNLNRHGVLHGLDFDYGTRLNSLKALSLLAFVGDFLVKQKPC
jgi:hypothetical protein